MKQSLQAKVYRGFTMIIQIHWKENLKIPIRSTEYGKQLFPIRSSREPEVLEPPPLGRLLLL
jgi:hypothetical protein